MASFTCFSFIDSSASPYLLRRRFLVFVINFFTAFLKLELSNSILSMSNNLPLVGSDVGVGGRRLPNYSTQTVDRRLIKFRDWREWYIRLSDDVIYGYIRLSDDVIYFHH